jgi:hypothetical protein
MEKKPNLASVFWGLALILAGGVFLAQTLGWIDLDGLSTQTWMIIFAAASLLFLVTYLLDGWRKWGWLFPVLIFAALALTLWMALAEVESSIIGAPILLAIALPFLAAFLIDRRRHWWALIPFWVMFVITLIVAFAESINGNFIGALVLYSIGLPFLVVYLVRRSRRWALIPAAVMLIIGTIPLTAGLFESIPLFRGINPGLVPMVLFALPFYVVTFRWKSQWWALIPAGIFTSIALVVALTPLFPENAYEDQNPILTGVLLLGFGLTFGLLWLRRRAQPTDWAKYPAAGLLAAGLLAVALGDIFLTWWPIALVVVGLILIGVSLVRTKKPE